MFGKKQWIVLHCQTGKWTFVNKLPFEIGSGEGVDLRLNGIAGPEKSCVLVQGQGRGLRLVRLDPASPPLVNGLPGEAIELEPDQDYSVQAGGHFLVIRGGGKLDRWRKQIGLEEWFLYEPESQVVEGPASLLELCRTAREQGRSLGSAVAPRGLSVGFYLHQALEVLGPELGALTIVPPSAGVAAPHEDLLAPNDQGSLTCPVCWRRFDEGDIMHIAVHDSLNGDPILGPERALRFHATRFNHRGQALDAMGLPCTDIACPHCRRELPPGFLDTKHYIFSIVGDQSSGKSYYLSVLARMLPISLYKHFGVVFQDADPAGNAMLNSMKKALFSASSPEQARLIKTQLDGAMYERVPYYGRIAPLPKPFVFFMASSADAARKCSIIFYDNAGEHFQPGRDSVTSPGAQHVAASEGLFFLFDPFNNPEFRDRIAGHPDPQFEKPVDAQQDIILSELKIRIKRLLRLDIAEKHSKPLAVIIGKCDAWMHLLGPTPFRDPLARGHLD